MAAKKRRRPLTAKVRRGLADIVPLISINIENGEAGEFQHLKAPGVSDVEAALAWLEQFAATSSKE